MFLHLVHNGSHMKYLLLLLVIVLFGIFCMLIIFMVLSFWFVVCFDIWIQVMLSKFGLVIPSQFAFIAVISERAYTKGKPWSSLTLWLHVNNINIRILSQILSIKSTGVNYKNHILIIVEPPTMLLVPICRDMQLWWDNPQYRAPENACQVRHVLMT